jgi:hypothetical protein
MKLVKNVILHFTLFAVILGLAGCGGSDGESGSSLSANGLWEGTFTEAGVGTYAVGSLFYNGRIIAISEDAGAIYDGNYTVSGSTISGTVKAYQINGGQLATATLSGTVSEQNSISLTFSTSYGSTGSMSLSFNSIYNRNSSLSSVEGSWNYTSSSYSLAATVQNDGSFFGQDSDGCVLSGDIGLLDTEHNLYSTTLSVAACGALNGNYTGFSGLLDDVTANDTLQVAVSNSNYIIVRYIRRIR